MQQSAIEQKFLYAFLLQAHSMSGLSAEKIVKLLEEDVRSRKRLAELLVIEPDIRLAIVNAIIRDVATKDDVKNVATKDDIKNMATKDDVERLRIMFNDSVGRLETRISGVEARIGSLEGRVGRLEGQMSLFIKMFIAFNLPILLGIIGILLKLIFS